MMRKKSSAQKTIRDIRRATRRHYSTEEKIRIVLGGLRGEDTIADLCRREGLNSNVYYRWSKEFMRAQIIELQSDLAQINALEKLNDLDDDALDIFLNELAIEIAFQQDSGTDVENRQAMLEALSNTRERIASQMAAEQLEIIDTYIGSERFRTFVLAPGSNGSAGADSLVR